MSKGYSMLSKELMDSEEYFSERFTRMQAYIDLCLLAAWKDRKFIKRGQVVELKAGQLAKSEEELADRWKWSRNTVRKYLNEQQIIGHIEQRKSRLITIITVKFGLNIAQQIEQQPPSKTAQQIEQQQEDIYKENKNIKEEESNDSKKKEEELLTRLSELEKSFAELSEENRNLQEENEELRKKKEKKKAQESFDVRGDLSYVDCFMDLWLEWLDYKDEIKKQYKTQRGAKSSFTEFKNLSHGNADKARAILDQSFRKSWDGLYDVKDWVEPEEKRDPTIPNTAKYEPDLPYDETMDAFLVPNKYPDLNEDWPYTPDNRPDGARICNGSNGWRWDAANKRWIEMLWIMDKKQWIDR